MCVCVRARGCAGTADGQGEQVCGGVWGVWGRVIGDQAVPGQEPTALAGVGVPFGFALYETKSRDFNL